MLTNRCEKKLVVLLINQKDYELYNQQTSTNEIRFTRYADAIFESRTKRAQKELIMQNKANFPNAQILVNCVLIRDCVNIRLHRRFKNKAKQTQFKANSNPIQTQFKPNSNPIQTQFKPNSKPIQTQFKPNSNPIKPNFKPVPPSSSTILHFDFLLFTYFRYPRISRFCSARVFLSQKQPSE